MDVEKTLQAILESQLRAERRADRADERMDRADKRADRADERADRADKRADRAEKRADKFDKQLNATKDLVREGMKIILKSNAEFRFRINALIDAQNRSDEKFNRWLNQQRGKRNNGHN